MEALGLFGLFVVLVILCIFQPLICFVSGLITGYFIKWTFAGAIISGLSLIGLNITPDQLPLLFGTIALIGGFFKSVTTNTKKD